MSDDRAGAGQEPLISVGSVVRGTGSALGVVIDSAPHLNPEGQREVVDIRWEPLLAGSVTRHWADEMVRVTLADVREDLR